MKRIHQILYGLMGAASILVGILALFAPAADAAGENHLIRELGAAAILGGMLYFWCMRNYEQRRGVHLSLVVFAVLLAGIHWHEFLIGQRTWLSPMVNTLPVVVLVGMMLPGRPKP